MKKKLLIGDEEFRKAVPWWLSILLFFNPFGGWDYLHDGMAIDEFGYIEYGYDEVEDLPKLYRKLVKE